MAVRSCQPPNVPAAEAIGQANEIRLLKPGMEQPIDDCNLDARRDQGSTWQVTGRGHHKVT